MPRPPKQTADPGVTVSRFRIKAFFHVREIRTRLQFLALFAMLGAVFLTPVMVFAISQKRESLAWGILLTILSPLLVVVLLALLEHRAGHSDD